VYAAYQHLNGWTNFYETLHVYHGTLTHVNGVRRLTNRYVCLCVYSTIVAKQRLGKNVTTAKNGREKIKELVNESFSMR
jgi:hypothetical protein